MHRILRSRILRDGILLLALSFVGMFLLTNPQEAIEACKNGLQLCANVIIPSLFPFFVLSGLIVKLGMVRYLDRLFEPIMRPLFGLSGACSAALALGMIGGYPIGARTALNLYESHQISKSEAERLLAFCNNCGPAFFFGVVGAGIFSSGSIALLLYLIHIMASLLIGMLLRLVKKPERVGTPHPRRSYAPAMRFPTAFTTAIKDGLTSTLNICAFIVCFTILIRFAFLSGIIDLCATALCFLLRPIGLAKSGAEALLVGMIELSSGVWGLKDAAMSVSSKVVMAAFILGWAGLCVHCQVLSFTGDSTLSVRPYLAGKFLHGTISAALVWLTYQCIPLRQSAPSCYISQVSSLCNSDFEAMLRSSSLTASIVWGAVCLICLIYMKKSGSNRQRNRV